MKFVFTLKPRHKKKSSSIKKVRFHNLRRTNSDSPTSLRRRSIKLISCASGFKDFRSRKGKKTEEDIVAKNRIDLDSIQYVYNPMGSLNTDVDVMSFNDSIRNHHVLFPTPRTPSMRVSISQVWEDSLSSDSVEEEEEEEACKCFERDLVEMICEDGKLKDLLDLEEFLKCWKDLSNPVYIGMVHGFYVNICKDYMFLHSERQKEEEEEVDHDNYNSNGNHNHNACDKDDNDLDDDDEDDDYELDIRSCPGAIYI